MMRNTSKKMLASSLASLIFAASNASAAEQQAHSGMYMGVGYGLLKARSSDDFDDDNNALQISVGGNVNQFFAVEGGYIDFGEYGGSAANADTSGFTLALKGSLPITPFASLYAKAGQLWWDTDYEVLGFKGDADGEEIFYGAGAAFALSKNVELQFEYVRYKVEFEREEVGLLSAFDSDTDLDHAKVGVQFNF